MSGTTKKTALASAFHTWAHGRHCNVKAERMCRSPSSYFFHLMRSFPGNSIPVGCWTRRQLDVCPPLPPGIYCVTCIMNDERIFNCNRNRRKFRVFQHSLSNPKVFGLLLPLLQPMSRSFHVGGGHHCLISINTHTAEKSRARLSSPSNEWTGPSDDRLVIRADVKVTEQPQK